MKQENYGSYIKNSPDVISGLDINIKKSGIFSILGGNISGKKTTLNILSGLDKSYNGKVKLCGKKSANLKVAVFTVIILLASLESENCF